MPRAFAARLAVLGGIALAPSVGFAQMQHDGNPHSGNPPAALGEVHFPVTCSAEAQAAFDGGMRLQHSFWYQAAGKEFREVRRHDPGCTMAHWGEALSMLTNPYSPPTQANLRQGRVLLEEARSLGARSERESAYVEALSIVFAGDDLAQHRARLGAYREAMESLTVRFPDDTEAAIHYALVLGVTASPTDKSYADQLRGAAILEREWERQPNHPGVVHYLIHLYDYPPLADRGVRAAERYSELAADAPHALHMPSHIFTRVGRWDASVVANQRAAARAVETGEPDGEFHALDYMVYAYLQTGQYEAAQQAIAGAGRATGQTRNVHAFASAAMPARYALERGAWAEAATLKPLQSAFPYAEALTHFARAIGFARSGHPEEAASDIEALRRYAADLKGRDAYWAEQVDIQRQTAEGWVEFAAGRQEDGLVTLRAAAERQGRTEKHVVTPGPLAPARELLAEALLEAGQPAPALREFEAVQQTEPRRFRSVYGAGRAAELAGDRDGARRHYTQLLAIAPRADSPQPELDRARTFVAQH
jgi:tetratricopeptide (TPR) repeat protein